MSDQQYTTPEKPEGFRSYPDNLRFYADHFDKYRTAADSDMTGAMRRSAADVEALRAQLSEAQARLVDEATLLDWIDAQRQDMVERDRHGDPELIGHSWFVAGQCNDVRTAIRMEMRAAGLGSAPVSPAAHLHGGGVAVGGFDGIHTDEFATPAAQVSQQPHRLKETAVVQSNSSAGPLSTQGVADDVVTLSISALRSLTFSMDGRARLEAMLAAAQQQKEGKP